MNMEGLNNSNIEHGDNLETGGGDFVSVESINDSRDTENLAQDIEASHEQIEIEKGIENLTENDREKAEWGLRNVGYKVEAIKNEVFEGAYSKVSERLDSKSTMGRFFSSLEEQFAEKGDRARNTIQNIEDKKIQGGDSSVMEKLGNVGYLSGNLLKYGRIATDAAGWTATSVYRSAILGSMMAASGFDAAKEARLKNEEVIDKTRVQDMDKAADEAWAIHQSAMQKKEMGEEVSAEDIQKTYEENIPKDILKRLSENPQPMTGTGILQRVFQKHVEWSASKMNNKFEKIDEDTGLSAEEKEKRKGAILGRFGRSRMLKDFDRLVTQQGTVDALGMSARYAEKGSKAVVYAVMADSIYKLWDGVSEMFSNGAEENALIGISDIPEELNTDTQEPEVAYVHNEEQTVAQEARDALEKAYDNTSENLHLDEQGEVLLERDSSTLALIVEEINETPYYTVQSGDNIWDIIENKLKAHDSFNNLGDEQQIRMINGFKSEVTEMSPEELKAFGIVSGDPNIIVAGENLDFSKIMDAESIKAGVLDAENLTEAQIASIETNDKILDEFAKANPDVMLTEEKINEILSGNVSEQIHTPVEHMDVSTEQQETPPTNPRIQEIDPAAVAEANKIVVNEVDRLYGSDGVFGSNFLGTEGERSVDWLDIKTKTVDEVMGKSEFPDEDVWNDTIEPDGINSEKAVLKTQEYIRVLVDQSGAQPFQGETVEEFMKRAMAIQVASGNSFRIPDVGSVGAEAAPESVTSGETPAAFGHGDVPEQANAEQQQYVTYENPPTLKFRQELEDFDRITEQHNEVPQNIDVEDINVQEGNINIEGTLQGYKGTEFLSEDYINKLDISVKGASLARTEALSVGRDLALRLEAYSQLKSMGSEEEASILLRSIYSKIEAYDKILGEGVIDRSKIPKLPSGN